MARKKYPCRVCGVVYTALKPNFYKRSKSKSGYNTDCKKCMDEAFNDWKDRQTPEKLEEIRLKNNERSRLAKKEGKYKPETEAQKQHLRDLSNLRYWKKKTIERLSNYESKVYWTEDQDWFLNDIKESEL